ncbi:AbrB/MazE/SpoVT family DNA-binding domain-containing protein [Halogeometricum borinquense]|uniref:AbrB/MazE/SpoVT family DNA-binding domain-containing protein n=2 Tax=Halogeometricum borinquense TaxID=60847 RepID=E4NU10_HALBP|nr:AbrB/MazE/SpoVT family DNA-binding domain-containing protein [Halogeometricum borinquense]ADQ68530.1 hypothetical protein Hbor_29930 [Halogeometricum borinquense DSM 11551]ELY25598.1 hypothetical protein C499_13985 [Halogeometricum borinquense DSM 11551]QIB75641.1 AbrB/MazE/SpoVT family DNA-binding domain-containing protein [Halogeometricum borinquense]RYJ08527.1 hypothetical protein ELS19_18645 [Halogeometricum borinquense]
MTEQEENKQMQMWPPAFLEQMQEAGERTMEAQNRMYRQFLSSMTGSDVSGLGQIGWRDMATFKTRVQSGGRISIPDAERETLDIEEGDIVQTIVIPINRDTE